VQSCAWYSQEQALGCLTVIVMCDTQVVRCACTNTSDTSRSTTSDASRSSDNSRSTSDTGTVSKAEHSRTSSVGSADGLLLSVSALAGGKGSKKTKDSSLVSPRSEEGSDLAVEEGRGGHTDFSDNSLSSEASNCNCDVRGRVTMGQGESRGEERDMANLVRMEPEGLNETDSQSYTSFLSVDKRLFGRLQEDLTQAQSELKLKEEQVVKLSRIRDDVERELEDLTASLFQEAHKMVQEANIKRAQAEKALAESDMKVDGLQTEVAALKTLVITSTPSMPNKHLHPHIGSNNHNHRMATEGADSAPSSPCKDRSLTSFCDQQDCCQEHRNIDPVLRAEYLAWKKAPDMSSSNTFLARIYNEDVDPCLDFPVQALSLAVRQAIHDNILCLSPVKPDTEENPRNCALLDQPRTARYKLRIDGEGVQEEHFISQLARNRVAAVCDFLTYCRYVTQGMVKSPVNDVYWEIMELRRKMICARLGF